MYSFDREERELKNVLFILVRFAAWYGVTKYADFLIWIPRLSPDILAR